MYLRKQDTVTISLNKTTYNMCPRTQKKGCYNHTRPEYFGPWTIIYILPVAHDENLKSVLN